MEPFHPQNPHVSAPKGHPSRDDPCLSGVGLPQWLPFHSLVLRLLVSTLSQTHLLFSKQTFKYVQRATSIVLSSGIQCKEILTTEVMSQVAVCCFAIVLCRLTEQVLLPDVLG